MAFAAILSVGFLFQGTWALAATTGGIAGVVHDDTGAPVAGAAVTASSPSQTATVTTDAQGHFVFLVLQPDTYTLTVSKDGYQTTSVAGNTVFADQTQQVVIVAPRQIAVIAHVHATAAGLVKPGIGGDLYNVTPAQQQASAALGGGGNLNNAYSAISALPGLVVGTGGMGWNQAVVIHGQDPWFTSFEVEGIPFNRAFDNYNSSTEPSLGLQELQVYTGGGPADITSNGVAGFINNVIKTGTYPGYANLQGGVATEAFYHQASFEAGGATPDRNFSYYVGLSGYDQDYRFIDNNDGASLMEPGDVFSDYFPWADFSPTGRGIFNVCNLTYSNINPLSDGCLTSGWGLYGSTSKIEDRENIVNLHFGIPRRDGQRDDIQLLWMDSAMVTYQASDPQEAGPGLLAGENFLGFGNTGYFGSGPVTFINGFPYNLPFGTVVNPGTGVLGTPTSFYGMPNQPASVFSGCGASFDCPIPTDTELDNFRNDIGAVKLQWTHPFNDTSYIRLYGYTLFTDWNEDSPISASTFEYFAPSGDAPNYMLITHTTGGSLVYANQVSDSNLISFEGNYELANSTRFNNTGFLDETSPIGLVADHGGTYSCYDQYGFYGPVGGEMPCYLAGFSYGTGQDTAYYNANFGEPVITGAALAAGAQYETLWNANTTGTYNTVSPHFWNASIQDQWRPNDRWLFNLAIRFDNFQEIMPNTATPMNNFEEQVVQNYVCWNPSLGALTYPLGPGSPPPPQIEYVDGACPSETIGPKTYAFVHPTWFTDQSPSSYTTYDWEPRLSLTYTSDPNTVWRFSAGRYAQPANSAAVQYQYSAGGSGVANLWGNFLDLGFFSPFHPIANMTSSQYSLSLEHHFRGSDVSMKITPFYSSTSNWFQDQLIGENFVTEIPVGLGENYGVEFALSDGDFNQNGLSGLFTFTYTQARVKYQPLLGLNQVEQINNVIADYNSLTEAGGGSPCYTPYTGPGTGTPAACGGPNIENPYYHMPEQSLLDPGAWYPQGIISMSAPGDNASGSWYNSPYVSSLVLNWRHDRFAVTPSLQFEAGTPYGSPLDFSGVDPRDCGANQTTTGIDPGNELCDYTTAGIGAGPYGYLFVPDAQTGKFATPGEFNEPNILLANVQLSYDFPKVRLTLTAANLWHTCFGGTQEPWTTANPPGQYYCGYGANGYYYGSGWYNGSSPNDTAANGIAPLSWQGNSYNPGTGNGIGSFLPFNLYVQAQIHL